MSKATMPPCRLCTIKEQTVWANLNETVMEKVADQRLSARYQKGDVIFHEGSPCTGIYNVCSGKVKLVRSGRLGRQTIVRIGGTGSTLAETDLFREDGRHGVTAQAMGEVVVCFLSKAALLTHMAENPGLALNMVARMSEQLHTLELRVESLATKDARLRLAEFLASLAEHEGEAVEGGIRISFRLTREEIAEVIGATLETTIRLVSAFKKEGVLADQEGHIVVRDVPRLQRLVRGGAGEVIG